MDQQTAKWYIIHTYSTYEDMVKSTLEKLIENNNLGDKILDIKIPREEVIEEKNDKKKIVLRKKMPCYVFIKMVYSNDLWYLITNTRGVTGFVGPRGAALPLTADEVRRMQLEDKVESVDFAVGDTIKILSGQLEGFIGTVEDLDFEQQKAKVMVSMFGRDTVVEQNFVQLEKLREQ